MAEQLSPPSLSTSRILSTLKGAATTTGKVVREIVNDIIFEKDEIPGKFDFNQQPNENKQSANVPPVPKENVVQELPSSELSTKPPMP